ncbi:MAG: site-specific integrase [Sandaracinaceae bacterium]
MARKRKLFSLFTKRGVYYASFYDGTGERIRVSTGQEEKTEAEKEGYRLATEYADKSYHAQDETTVNGELTIDALLNRFIEEKEVSELSHYTIRNYRRSFGHFLRLVGRTKPSKEITKSLLSQYGTTRRKEGGKLSTVKMEIRTIITALRWAKGLNILDVDLTDIKPEIAKGRIPPRKRFLSPLEIQKAIQEVKKSSPERLPHVLIYLNLGIRKEDIYSITPESVDLSKRVVTVYVKKVKKHIKLPMNDSMVKLFSELLNGAEPGKPLVRVYSEQWHQMTERWARRAGIPHFTIHDLRRTCGSLMASNGVPIRTIADILGHSDIKTTFETYAHLLPTTSHDAVAKLPVMYLH